ncbi:response regulator [Dokdonella sp. MW10]|uniref:response regulator n=1 Tax=Dokdonella sp. MW10 TaxID=2992926 RepID=UPI003F7E41A3
MPRVLVADDNPVALAFFGEAFARLGVDCVVASDGAEAVARANEAAFDLLLVDVNMPLLDGVATLAAIRSGGPSCGSPALATTAGDPDGRADLLAAGFAGVLPKPVSVTDLRRAIARHLPARMLDDARALEASAGDIGIVAALRGLLAAELSTIDETVEAHLHAGRRVDLRDLLHRLEASAGFCGAEALGAAVVMLRERLDGRQGIGEAVAHFREACTRTREALAKPLAFSAA